MNIMFIHQNFPGQFKHLVQYYSQKPDTTIVCIGESANLIQWQGIPGVRLHGYSVPEKAHRGHPYSQDFENSIIRGQAVAITLTEIKKSGYVPDCIFVHPGWGEGLYLKDIFPNAKVVMYCEYYYNKDGSDFGFERKREATLNELQLLRTRNATQTLSFMQADCLISPTEWQKKQFPDLIQSNIHVVHEGIDTEVVKPDSTAYISLTKSRLKLTRNDKVITFINRNLEPYRGFHVFMRALPQIQKKHPDAHIIIVGADSKGYGKAAPSGTTYREIYTKEIKTKVDWTKIHFLGRVPHGILVNLYQISSVHVYLTYPFVLSWSLLEAMSAECLIVGSQTPPVEEVITHKQNGLLVDFSSSEQLADTIDYALSNQGQLMHLRHNARNTITKNYSTPHCIAKIDKIIKKI